MSRLKLVEPKLTPWIRFWPPIALKNVYVDAELGLGHADEVESSTDAQHDGDRASRDGACYRISRERGPRVGLRALRVPPQRRFRMLALEGATGLTPGARSAGGLSIVIDRPVLHTRPPAKPGNLASRSIISFGGCHDGHCTFLVTTRSAVHWNPSRLTAMP
jgi:hypothetical protein